MFGVSNSNELWISFKDELSAQEIKIDIVKSGTRYSGCRQLSFSMARY